MTEICTLATAEVQEVAADTFRKLASGPVKVFYTGQPKVVGYLQIESVKVDFRLDTSNGPYRKVDSRTYHFSTEDIMGFYYLTFNFGTSDHDLNKADLVFKQLALGTKPVLPAEPIPGAEEADAAIQAAIADDVHKQQGAAVAPPGSNPLQQMGGFFQGLAKRAADDTAKLHEIGQKAAADTLLLAGQGAVAVQGAFQPKPAPQTAGQEAHNPAPGS